MSTEIDPVQIGQLIAKVAQLEKSNEEIKAELAQMLEILQQARGGWRTLMLVGGAAATAATLLQWLATHIKWGA